MAKSESKSYDPSAVEKRLFEYWEGAGHFKAQPGGDAPPFCIVIPPPNVTGALHLGHALNNTLQDILIRRARMAGANTFWLVGTDHAGIATQATVEKTIRKTEGKSRHDLGREELVRRIWEWKEKYGSRIVEQLKLMGCSCDYSRERFTLDPGCAKAVRETFFKLFRDGLIYRGKRLVNWDTELQTAVADDEVYHETVKGHFYHLKYPLVGDGHGGDMAFVHVATTRPETMLGDTAVAVHPDPAAALDRVEAELREKLRGAGEKDRAEIAAQIEAIVERRATHLPTLLRLRDLARAGAKVRLPLTNREIPLIVDEWARPELGSGCVKITPAHDPNDYEVFRRHPEIGMINVLTADGKIAEIVEPDGRVNPASAAYAGLKFATAGREKVVADLTAGGFVEKIEDRQIEIGHSDRSKSPIEPFLSDQWFVKMGDLTPDEAGRVAPGPFKDYVEGRANSADGGIHARASGVAGAALRVDEAERRVDAEERRMDAEERRVDAEERRVDAEERRMDAEERRMDAKERRMDAEERRVDAAGKNIHEIQNFVDQKARSVDAEERRVDAKSRRVDAKGPGSTENAASIPGLAQMAIEAVRDGRVKFHPDRYAKTYIDWLGEKRDWCISRQLWWGHRIPVWAKVVDVRAADHTMRDRIGPLLAKLEMVHHESGTAGHRNSTGDPYENSAAILTSIETGQVFRTEDFFGHRPELDGRYRVEICLRAATTSDTTTDYEKELESAGFVQDPDVLDTWFSSALWPHSTLGWPDATQTRHKHGTTARADARGSSALDEGSSAKSAARDGQRAPLPDGRGSVQSAAGAASQSPDRQIAQSPNPQASSPKPQAENLLATFYPTSVLSTAREIITLWVARMVMFGLYNLGEVPFEDVVIHPVIQDGQGRKMSKSLGNGVDPVDIIDKYGADALRFTLAELATETQDIRMPVTKERQSDGREINVSTKFEKGRNFCNKLWQAATGYVLPNLEGHAPRPIGLEELKLEDRWILSRMTSCLARVDEALGRYRFAEAMGELYHFMWDDYCSAYIEMTKPRMNAADSDVACQVLAFVLDRLLRMLHPVTPYVTEGVWQEMRRVAPQRGLTEVSAAEDALISAAWPMVDERLRDPAVEREMERIQAVIRTGREIRTMINEYRGQAKAPTIRSLPLMIVSADAETAASFGQHADFIRVLSGCEALEVGEGAAKPAGSVSRVIGPVTVHVPVGNLIDLGLVRATEEKKLADLRTALERAEKQLSNENFVSRADPGIVEQARQRAAELRAQIEAGERHVAEMG